MIKRGAEISFPVPIGLLLPPAFLFPLTLISSSLSLYSPGRLDCPGVLGGEVSDPGSFNWSIAQALVISLEHSGDGLLRPAPVRTQPRPWIPAASDHHLVAGTGRGEAVLGGGGLSAQAKLVQGGGDMGRGVAAEVAPTHLTPLALGDTGGGVKRGGYGLEKTHVTADMLLCCVVLSLLPCVLLLLVCVGCVCR